MLQAIVENNRILNNFLNEFRDAFQNQAQVRHFQHYVIAIMIYLSAKNLSGLSRAIPDGRDQSSLYRFLATQDWDVEQVKQIRLEMLNRKARRALKAMRRQDKKPPVYLIIDDSLVEKTGKKMEGVAKHRSHKDHNQLVLGHVWVTAQLVVAGYSYPLDWAVYRRQWECEQNGVEFMSKPDLAYRMIASYQPLPDTQPYVMTDSWYSSQDLLKLCRQRGFHFIGAVKSNRKLRIGSHNLQVKQWQAALPKSAFERVKLNDKRYKVWATIGHLSCGQQVKALVNRRVGVKKWHYLISTNLELSAKTIIAYYLVRWEVENFYRAAKQILGWGDYQMRALNAIENHVLLMMVTHAYLEIQRWDALDASTEVDAHFTLGDLQRAHQRTAQRATIALVFSLTQQGLDLEDIFDRLAA
jgi:SRSO17 transposase